MKTCHIRLDSDGVARIGSRAVTLSEWEGSVARLQEVGAGVAFHRPHPEGEAPLLGMALVLAARARARPVGFFLDAEFRDPVRNRIHFVDERETWATDALSGPREELLTALESDLAAADEPTPPLEDSPAGRLAARRIDQWLVRRKRARLTRAFRGLVESTPWTPENLHELDGLLDEVPRPSNAAVFFDAFVTRSVTRFCSTLEERDLERAVMTLVLCHDRGNPRSHVEDVRRLEAALSDATFDPRPLLSRARSACPDLETVPTLPS